MVKSLSTVSQIKEAFSDHCIGPQTDNAKKAFDSANRFDKLTTDAIRDLNEHTEKYSETFLVDLSGEGVLNYLLGLEPMPDGGSPFITIGKESYVALRNRNNRKVSLTRVGPIGTEGTYANVKSRGFWGLTASDPITYDWDGQIISGQHRFLSELYLRNAGLPLGKVYIYLGVPPQWRDLVDKARSRKETDDDTTDDTVCNLDIIAEVQLAMHGETDSQVDIVKLRHKAIELRKKITGSLADRMSGSDIRSSGDKLSRSQRFQLIDRLGGEDEVTRYVVTLLESQRSTSGKYDRQWSELWNPSIVGVALLLACNDEDSVKLRVEEIVQRQSDETPEEYVERQIAAKCELLQDGPIVIDWDLVKSFLDHLGKSSSDAGPFSSVFTDIFERMKSDKKTEETKKYLWAKVSTASMSAMVQLINNYRSGDFTSSVWTTYRKNKDGEVSPFYRCFGGIDIGYTKVTSKRGKKSDE